MKTSHIAIIILVLVLGGGILYFVQGDKLAKAPTPEVSDQTGIVPAPDPLLIVKTETTTTITPVVKEFRVKGTNFVFDPSTIMVNKGDRVKITFENSAGFHDFKIDEYGVATKQTQSPTTKVLEFIADKAGSFEYYCSVGSHRALGMKGTLVVN